MWHCQRTDYLILCNIIELANIIDGIAGTTATVLHSFKHFTFFSHDNVALLGVALYFKVMYRSTTSIVTFSARHSKCFLRAISSYTVLVILQRFEYIGNSCDRIFMNTFLKNIHLMRNVQIN